MVNMADKKKIDSLIHYYIKHSDVCSIGDTLGIEDWELRFIVGEIIKDFTYPMLENGHLIISEEKNGKYTITK